MKSRIISLLLLLVISINAGSQTYSGGDGTEGNPFQITNLTDLQYLSEHSSDWGLYFLQTADIEASETSTWNSGAGFASIGTYITLQDNVPFTGSYDGGGHIITGLTINRSGTNGVAMFAYTEGANIENLGLVNVSVVGNELVSALVGRTGETTTIKNCFSTGAISSGSYYGYVGGIVGCHSGSSSIENSYSRASITGTRPGGTRCLGGLAGYAHVSSVANCYSTGAVSGGIEGYVGGLIGWSMATESNNFWDTESSGQETSAAGTGKTTTEMQSTSLYVNAGWDFMEETINGIDDIWGISSAENGGYPFLAWQGYTNEAELLLSTQHVTNISTLSLSATANGTIYTLGTPAPEQHGVCWNTTGNPTLADSYTEEGVPSSGSFTSEMTGLTNNEVYYVRAYATNSNETVYGNEVSFVVIDAVAPSAGDGTSSSPYEIANLENLLWLSENQSEWAAGKYFIQTNDIDASASIHLDEGKGLSPIGIYEWGNFSNVSFQGSYDGQGYSIDGLHMDRTEHDYTGLFGLLYGSASVKNLGVTNANINCKGGAILVGCVYSGNVYVSNCHVNGTIASINGYTGGLVGFLAYGTVDNCFSNSVVVGNVYIGALVGQVYGGEIYNSYAGGSVTQPPSSGYMTYTGGFAGAIRTSTVNNCYSTATVGDGDEVGGFVAYFDDATVSNCFWDTQTSGQASSEAGIGKTTTEMQSACTFLDAGWDFADEEINGTDYIWTINSSDNGGYPALTWQGFANTPVFPAGAVNGITFSDITDNSITLLEFNAPTNGADGYAIYVNHEDANWTIPEDGVEPTPIVGDYDGNGPECIYYGTSVTPGIEVTGLNPSTSYFFKVYAYNSCTNVYWEKTGVVDNRYTKPASIPPVIGDGSIENPYEIATLENLYWLSQQQENVDATGPYWSRNYIQTADIDASETSTWDDGDGGDADGFSPIGNGMLRFSGTYNGQEFSINGLTVNRPMLDYVGLFGAIENASINNVRLVEVSVNGGISAGSLVGSSGTNSSVSNSSCSGSVTGAMFIVGGLIGENVATSSVSNSYSTVNVVGADIVGGLVGANVNSSLVTNSYCTGNVSGNQAVGGLVGFNGGSIVNNVYSKGSVTGAIDVGGLIGFSDVPPSLASFWDVETSGQPVSANGIGLSTTEMQSLCTFLDAGWDFANEDLNGSDYIWTINPSDNGGYPALSWQGYTSIPVAPTEVVEGITFSDITENTIVLQGFTAPASGADGYAIYVNHEDANWTIPEDGVEPTPIVGDYDGNGSDCIYYGTSATPAIAVTGLDPNTNYFFKVYAYNSCDNVYWEKTGTIAAEETVFYPSGNSLSFDGVDDYVSVDHDASLNVANTVTVEAWIYPTDLSSRYTVFSTRSSNPAGSWNLEVGTADGDEDVVAVSGTGTWVAESVNNSITINEWNHIAFVKDGSTTVGSIKLYVNGIEVNLQSEAAYNFIDNNNIKTIGRGSNGTQFFPGKIDELRVWNEALTQTQLQDNMYAILTGSESNLVAYYRFDQGDAGVDNTILSNQLVDYAGCNNGSLFGFALNGETSNWVFNGNEEYPILTTTEVNSVTLSAATIVGNIFSTGETDVTTRGFQFASDECFTSDLVNIEESGTFLSESYSLEATGLLPATYYFVKAYAINSQGTSYGETIMFSTCGAVPDQVTNVTTGAITSSSIQLTGFTQPQRGADGYVVFVNSENSFVAPETNDDFSSASEVYISGQQAVYFNASIPTDLTISNLEVNTSYYIKVFAYFECEGIKYYEQVGTLIDRKTSPVATPPSIGDGSIENPYEIATLENLYWLSQQQNNSDAVGPYWSRNYIQTADIDATETSTWDDGNGGSNDGFEPIGNSTVAFTGTYDGQDYSISNLLVNRPSSDNIGLFGISGVFGDPTIIKNLYLNSINIIGNNNVGGLVGKNNVFSEIENISLNGSINGKNNVGGLVGYNNYQIINSFSSANVNGVNYVGGFIGINQANGRIYNSYSTGVVSGSLFYIGGFVGVNVSGTISDSYSTGNVSGYIGTGGFMGNCQGNNAVVSNSYSTGSVSGMNSNGGFVGSYMSGDITNCFWDTQTSGQATSAGGTGKTTAEMKEICTFLDAGWDFADEDINGTENKWTINSSDNEGYPALAWQGFTNEPVAPTGAVSSIVLSDITDSSIILQEFTAPANGAEGYAIYINHEDANWTTPVDGVEPTTIVGNYDGDGSECIYYGTSETPNISLTGLHPNTSYFFKVYAYNSCTNVYWEKEGAIANETTLQKELTISGTFTVNSKDYDGTTDGVIAVNDLALDGVVGDDVVSLDNELVEFASSDVGSEIFVSIISAELTGDNANNYTLSLAGAPSTTADITAKSLSITANSESKVYGESDPVFSVTYDGFVNGEDENVLGGTLVVERALGEYVGDYSITASGLTSTNYSINFVNGILTIVPIELTVEGTFTVLDKEYDGTTEAAFATNSLTISGVLDGETVTISPVVSFADKHVGVDKTVNLSNASILEGADADNYSLSISGAPTATATITAKSLGVTGAVAADKVYDGTTAATISGATLEGAVNDDDVTLASSAIGVFAQIAVGTEISVTTTMTINGVDAGNYTLTQPEGLMADITPKELTVTGAVAADKVYDGTTVAAISGATLSGLVDADVVTLADHTEGTFAQKDVGTAISVSTAMTIEGVDAGNYSLTQPEGLEADITMLELTIGGTFTVLDKEYDGTTEATIDDNSLTLVTPVSGDAVSLSDVSVSFADAEVGEDKTVSITAAILDGADKGNYTLSLAGAPTATASIFVSPTTTFTVTFSVVGESGELEASVEGTSIESGDQVLAEKDVVFVATPSDGYQVKEWVVNGSPIVDNITNTHTVANLLTNTNVTIEFEEIPPAIYTLTLEVTPEDAGTVTGAGEYVEGEEVTITATPAEGYLFQNWRYEGAVISSEASMTYTMPAEDITLIAHFVEEETETYTLTLVASPPEGGLVIGGGEFTEGEVITVVAQSTEGYQFVNWIGAVTEALEATTSFTMPAEDVTLIANFELEQPVTFTVTFTVTDNQENPVQGASVVIDGVDETLTTSTSGEATVELENGDYNYSVTANGFEAANGSFTITGENVSVEVELVTVGVGLNPLANIEVFPNPFRSEITLRNISGVKRVVLTNLIGQKVKEFTLTGRESETLRVDELNSGIYLILLETANGERTVRKLVKE